jgi:hypothetical protein
MVEQLGALLAPVADALVIPGRLDEALAAFEDIVARFREATEADLLRNRLREADICYWLLDQGVELPPWLTED